MTDVRKIMLAVLVKIKLAKVANANVCSWGMLMFAVVPCVFTRAVA